MLEALSRELITWLGYLQRTTVLVQVAIVVITVVLDKRSRLTRRVNSEFLRSVSPPDRSRTPDPSGLRDEVGGCAWWLSAVPGTAVADLALD